MLFNKIDFKKHALCPFKKNKGGSTIGRIILMFILICSAVCAIVSLILLKSLSSQLPSSEEILSYEPSLATVVYDRNDEILTRLFQENRTWVKLDSISPHMVKAILAAEDDSFYEHGGVRPIAIIRAGLVDLFHHGAKQGGSTITQQLARNLFLTKEKTITRKIKEAILSLRMEQIYTKDQLLEMYLNTIYMGHGAYGIDSAAKLFYGKKPADLTIPESAVIAGLIAAPEKYSPYRNSKASMSRRLYVLGRMLDLNWISKTDYDNAVTAKLKYMKRKPSRNALVIKDGSYFVSYLLFNHLLPVYGSDMVYRGGLKVSTTIDADLQRKAEELVSEMKCEGALVALDPNTGEILALVGGRNFEKSKFNRATQAYRQPGSAFKSVVYAAALEKGYRGVDHILDARLEFPNGWEPHNYSNKFRGEVTLMYALAKSINTPAVRIAQITGIRDISDFARRIGITTPYLPEDLSLALGAASVTPMEMAVAYSAFANNGFKVKPYGIREITERTGKSIEQNGPKLKKAISVTTSIETRSLLEQVVLWGTGRRAQIDGYEVFGKTGTTNDWTDAWFAGGVPGLVVIVYGGNDNHKSLGKGRTGASVALPVWKEFVSYATKKLDLPNKFIIPGDAGVEAVSVCRETGYLATDDCIATNILLPLGTAPEDKCPKHGKLELTEYITDYVVKVTGHKTHPENDPKLLIAPIDEQMKELGLIDEFPTDNSVKKALEKGDTSAETTDAANTAVKRKDVKIIKEKKVSPAPSPNKNPAPYKNTNEQDDIERRYQELLKKYNIS